MALRSIALKSHPAKTVSRRPKAKRPRVIDTKKRDVPINVRQSGNSEARMLISTRVRKNPYWHLSQQEGCWAYTVYNHMYHPRAYISMMQGGLMKEYEYLTKHVTMWNVAVERQIQVKGPDAADFVNKLITRDVHKKLPVNMCRYVILCNQDGGIINDPVLLRVAEDEFWFSISDSDVLLWAQGVNATAGYNVTIKEIDVSPVQIQGPKSVKLMTKLFGRRVLNIPYYGLLHAKLGRLNVVISRTGFSGEVGYEIYLHDAVRHADEMWNAVKKAGEPFNLRVIAPSHIRRLEAGILSYGQDMDIETNPYEVGLGWQVDLSKEDFYRHGRAAEDQEAGGQTKARGPDHGRQSHQLVQRGLLVRDQPCRSGSRLCHQRLLVADTQHQHRARDAAHRLRQERHQAQGRAAGRRRAGECRSRSGSLKDPKKKIPKQKVR